MVHHGFGNRPRPTRGGGTRGQTGPPANFRQSQPEIHGSLVSLRYAIESLDHAISADSSGGAGGKRRGLPTEGDARDGGMGLLLVGGEAGAAHQVRRPGGDSDAADQQSGAAGGGGQGGGYRSRVEGDLCGGEGQGSGRAHPDGADFRGRRGAGRHAGGADSQDPIRNSVGLQQFQPAQRRVDGGGFPQGRHADHSARYQTQRGEVLGAHRNPLAALLRQYGSGAAGSGGTRVERAAGNPRGQPGQQGPGGGDDVVYPGACGGRAVRSRRRPCGTGQRRGGHYGDGDLAGGHVRVRGAQGSAPESAARGDADPLHRHGTESGPDGGAEDGGARGDRFPGDGEAPFARRRLHAVQRRSGFQCDAGGGRDQGRARHDPEERFQVEQGNTASVVQYYSALTSGTFTGLLQHADDKRADARGR